MYNAKLCESFWRLLVAFPLTVTYYLFFGINVFCFVPIKICIIIIIIINAFNNLQCDTMLQVHIRVPEIYSFYQLAYNFDCVLKFGDRQ